MKISIINGPNLNLIGTREPEIYGNDSLNEYIKLLIRKYPSITFTDFQSNIEGELINEIQLQGDDADAIIINAGAYTHTSIAIADALRAVKCKKIIEVHISNVYAREHYRRESHIAPACMGSICGFGLKSYELAVLSLLH
ncbi:MAG: 3-dehydroquinate dehydratase [Bacteroidetes bacterium]|jgi:3-dehydroquinate dehydratase-2|nr:3-dehydroquinate dehydratase [Bacteroidota bacterium]HMT36446.1 type II 3-dehydroquinate dehydratase [Chitinophagaceae bacterium]MBK6818887.1 3-dehydroquinate dehydratase [Bacteroidota bacterium]MBK7041771.1 3-dehydroquinate dehydratase [Bacteroidota bacterium]MBK7589300.1 3-dehydroquinate dehydratase [Bacteroidota bacterium]